VARHEAEEKNVPHMQKPKREHEPRLRRVAPAALRADYCGPVGGLEFVYAGKRGLLAVQASNGFHGYADVPSWVRLM